MERMSTSDALRSLPHRSYSSAQLVLAAGRRGQGKTTLMRGYLERCEPRVLALDPFNDFRAVRRAPDIETALQDLDFGVGNEPCRRRLCPPIGDDSQSYADALFTAAIDGDPPLRECLLALDEMTLWSESRETVALRTLVLQGRRLGIRMLVACQRISLVPGVLLSECTELVIYRTTRPRDLDVLREWAGRDVSEMASKLTVGECMVLAL